MRLARREHEFCYGHRVAGHENKCANLHGHNGKVLFSIKAANGQLDTVGRVLDFSEMKATLCEWLEQNWDHKMLLWENDPLFVHQWMIGGVVRSPEALGVVFVPFNPTAENMADYLLYVVGPLVLKDTGAVLHRVEFFETSKCSVIVEL